MIEAQTANKPLVTGGVYVMMLVGTVVMRTDEVPCFLGQRLASRLRAAGMLGHLVAVEASSRAVPRAGNWALFAEGLLRKPAAHPWALDRPSANNAQFPARGTARLLASTATKCPSIPAARNRDASRWPSL